MTQHADRRFSLLLYLYFDVTLLCCCFYECACNKRMYGHISLDVYTLSVPIFILYVGIHVFQSQMLSNTRGNIFIGFSQKIHIAGERVTLPVVGLFGFIQRYGERE